MHVDLQLIEYGRLESLNGFRNVQVKMAAGVGPGMDHDQVYEELRRRVHEKLVAERDRGVELQPRGDFVTISREEYGLLLRAREQLETIISSARDQAEKTGIPF